MNERIFEQQRDDLLLSTDRARLDVDTVLAWLLASHWGSAMTREKLDRAIENSVCFAVYRGDEQLCFARAVTDLATYAYLTDVIVAEHARGHGLGKWMVGAIVAHPDLVGLRRTALWTRDAPTLYEQFGFTTVTSASTYMELRTQR
jgi:N-acetylglutamate synthase-like GNAT family acetyltransferase